ncbi:hypothetical protein Drorol1_Dr00012263 [Drosera rotundifolia]
MVSHRRPIATVKLPPPAAFPRDDSLYEGFSSSQCPPPHSHSDNTLTFTFSAKRIVLCHLYQCPPPAPPPPSATATTTSIRDRQAHCLAFRRLVEAHCLAFSLSEAYEVL